ncbi:Kinase [Hexamita inflata]|uniref:AGC PDK1 n=1 Tax=Hexamita inflata TaxID=28002 RepID=A0AA86UCU8_9EUKA|nr:AGC PDK1 [Hexamita inflata]
MSNIAGLFNTIDASRSTDFVQQQLLGEGAFGKVSKAIHIPTKIKLALKEVDVAKLEQVGELRTLTREMELLQAIRDQNIYNLIPRYYGHYQLQSKVYLISELCTHGDLSNLVKYCGKVPANIVKYIASQLISLQLWEVELLFLVYYVSNYILKYFATSNADDKFQQIISSWRLFMNYSLTQEGQKYDFDRIRPQSTIQSRYLIFQKGKIEITTCNKRTAMTKINAVEDVQGRSTNSLNKLRQF